VGLLLLVLPIPLNSEVAPLLVGAPPKLKPVFGTYLLLLLPPPTPKRLPVAGGFVEAPVLLPNNEVALFDGEVVDGRFTKLVVPPPNKFATGLLFAGGGFVPLFWPNRLVPREAVLLPNRLVPGAVLLFMLCFI